MFFIKSITNNIHPITIKLSAKLKIGKSPISIKSNTAPLNILSIKFEIPPAIIIEIKTVTFIVKFFLCVITNLIIIAKTNNINAIFETFWLLIPKAIPSFSYFVIDNTFWSITVSSGINLSTKILLIWSIKTITITNIKIILKEVYEDLKEKGYNPINQIVGYILSGDPTYITSYNDARTKIRTIERDELLENMVMNYIGLEK